MVSAPIWFSTSTSTGRSWLKQKLTFFVVVRFGDHSGTQVPIKMVFVNIVLFSDSGLGNARRRLCWWPSSNIVRHFVRTDFGFGKWSSSAGEPMKPATKTGAGFIVKFSCGETSLLYFTRLSFTGDAICQGHSIQSDRVLHKRLLWPLALIAASWSLYASLHAI